MFECFEAYITPKVDLTKEQLRYMCSLATVRKVRRRQLLVKEGEVCRHKIFISKGLLRTYRLKDDGNEYIMRFSPENSWNVDHESYNNQTPTKYNVDALEDSELLLWSKEDFDELIAAIPAIRAFSDRIKESSYDASQERVLMNISYTAEEKYEDFITSFPDIFRRVPLHMVASYLGVSRETLTRVRQARFKQQKDN
ncbi:Crp/Fnr family transcriptional regulator [Chitinophaga sp. S165]|uniref:Crp/Fnr family transcriptional regulator n=1 Tax=Chitinophaga sp. S165 TaxID=2135462 RepID=UPI000D715A17|nr:Crp/Fnr family transcriptional regulator [Chitinophaga sp. S165]PWV51543.1 CRP-like cAMP-binding protein [Chitinophaga sp. S165]